jgi:hypothetical protein
LYKDPKVQKGLVAATDQQVQETVDFGDGTLCPTCFAGNRPERSVSVRPRVGSGFVVKRGIGEFVEPTSYDLMTIRGRAYLLPKDGLRTCKTCGVECQWREKLNGQWELRDADTGKVHVC